MSIKVPRKIVIAGNKSYGLKFLGEAQSQLAILENQMKFQNLSQGSRKVKLNDNIHIECWSCFSAQGIKITTFGVPEVPPLEFFGECLCLNCFTYGKIIKRYPDKINDDTEDDILVRILYDVEFCSKDGEYIRLDNYIYGSSYEEYFIDDTVILGMLPNPDLNCCEEVTRCAFGPEIIGFDEWKIMIFSFEIGNMEEWQ